MDSDREHRIRKLAYQIWEKEGSLEGRECEHWRQAELQIDSEGSSAPGQTESDQGIALPAEISPGNQPEHRGHASKVVNAEAQLAIPQPRAAARQRTSLVK